VVLLVVGEMGNTMWQKEMTNQEAFDHVLS
jgi:hypothetical protein